MTAEKLHSTFLNWKVDRFLQDGSKLEFPMGLIPNEEH